MLTEHLLCAIANGEHSTDIISFSVHNPGRCVVLLITIIFR